MNSLYKTFSLASSHEQNDKLTILFLISLAICFYALPACAQYQGGTGTEGDPYLIATAEQMNKIGTIPGDWNKHFKLTADIDMNNIAGTDYNIIGYWTNPYATDNKPFTGVFDGNDHTISNFTYSSTDAEGIGLFSSVSGEIKNLGLVNPNIFAQGGYVGSLAGYLNQGTIKNCYAKRADVSAAQNVGGLVGLNDGRIQNCCSTGNVTGDAYVGGLVGYVSDGKVTMSYSRANVSGNRNVGGLVGKTGKISSEVTDCYARGSVEASTYVGGLAGQVEQGVIYKCYSSGNVLGNQYVGGLVGHTRVNGRVSRSFWDTQTSGQLTSAGGTGKTTIEMKTMSTYTDNAWDFWNFWEICPGTNYPILIWQIPVADFLCPDGVNFIDFAFFASNWHRNHCNPANYYCDGTDLNRSGSVDIRDLQIFTEHWLEGLD